MEATVEKAKRHGGSTRRLLPGRLVPWRRLPEDVFDRVPPSDLACERAVVGGLIVAWHDTRYCGAKVVAELDGWDFHAWDYRGLFKTLRKRWHVISEFNGVHALYAARAVPMPVADLAEAIYDGDALGLLTNAARLRELRIQRERIHAATTLLQLAWETGRWGDANQRSWMSEARRLLNQIGRNP